MAEPNKAKTEKTITIEGKRTGAIQVLTQSEFTKLRKAFGKDGFRKRFRVVENANRKKI